jgi:AcrR family transcriptional regulator
MAEPNTPTEQRILAAARAEFAEHGFAGARVERIARVAECNKQLIYHYFGSKEGLSRAVFHDMLVMHQSLVARLPTSAEDLLVAAFRHVGCDPDWVRMILWERLTLPDLFEPEARRAQFESILPFFEFVEPPEIRRHVALACMSMATFPSIMPTLTQLIVGQQHDADDFDKTYAEALRWVIRRVAAAHGEAQAKPTKADSTE